MRSLFGWKIFLLTLFFLNGCICNNSLVSNNVSDQNVYNLSRLTRGMNQKSVLQIMRHPYSEQTFEMEDATYDVWFYVTSTTVLGQCRMVPRNLTPLAFKDGILIGWGFVYYNYLCKRQEAAYKEQRIRVIEKKEEHLEDIEVEKILTPSVNKPQTPPSTQPPSAKPNWGPVAPSSGQSKSSQPQTPEPQSEEKPAGSQKTPPQKRLDKSSQTPSGKKSQDWGPVAPPSSPEPQQNPKTSSSLSMFRASTNKPENTPVAKEKKEEQTKPPPLSEEDEQMLEEESEQNFNQN